MQRKASLFICDTIHFLLFYFINSSAYSFNFILNKIMYLSLNILFNEGNEVALILQVGNVCMSYMLCEILEQLKSH